MAIEQTDPGTDEMWASQDRVLKMSPQNCWPHGTWDFRDPRVLPSLEFLLTTASFAESNICSSWMYLSAC